MNWRDSIEIGIYQYDILEERAFSLIRGIIVRKECDCASERGRTD